MQLSSAVLKLLAAVVVVLLFTKFPLVALVQAFVSSPPLSVAPDQLKPAVIFCESAKLLAAAPGVAAARVIWEPEVLAITFVPALALIRAAKFVAFVAGVLFEITKVVVVCEPFVPLTMSVLLILLPT